MGMKASNKIATFFKYFVLILVGIIMIYPLLWMISATFKDNSEIFAGISLWIKSLRWMATATPEQLRRLHQHPAGHAQHLQLCHPQGDLHCGVCLYCRLRLWPFRLPRPQAAVQHHAGHPVPAAGRAERAQYLLYNKFGWVDSPFYLAIWVHCAFATETYFVYQLVQFMRNVPRDLDEAAAIDGCSSFQTLYKVIVPMLGPALVSCALFQFMWSCNDFMGPLLYVSTPGKYPMSLFVKLSMDGDTGFAWNKILALSSSPSCRS